MIADINSPESSPESFAIKTDGRQVERRTGDHAAAPVAAGPSGAELAAEHDLFALAFRKFEALLPGIEALTTDVV